MTTGGGTCGVRLSDAELVCALTDRARLDEILELGLLSPEVDTILDEMAGEAARHFGLPVSLVSVVFDEAQYFAGMYGLTGWLREKRGTPVEWSFCQFAVATREPLVIENAAEDPLVSDNPLVQDGSIRCYAGVPLISSRGFALGSFCVVGNEARTFTEREIEDLRGFAANAVARIEMRRRK